MHAGDQSRDPGILSGAVKRRDGIAKEQWPAAAEENPHRVEACGLRWHGLEVELEDGAVWHPAVTRGVHAACQPPQIPWDRQELEHTAGQDISVADPPAAAIFSRALPLNLCAVTSTFTVSLPLPRIFTRVFLRTAPLATRSAGVTSPPVG